VRICVNIRTTLDIALPNTDCKGFSNTNFYFKTVWPCIVIDSLWIKPTDALSSSFIGITTLHVSGSLSAHHQEFLAIHRHWYNLCSLVTEWYQAQVTKLHKLHQYRCTAKNSWWWAERLPKTCRVLIPIKLELSASVCFIDKETNFYLFVYHILPCLPLLYITVSHSMYCRTTVKRGLSPFVFFLCTWHLTWWWLIWIAKRRCSV
jgi:hypothetical protein